MKLLFITKLLFFVAVNQTFAQKPEAIKDYNAGLEHYNLKNYEAAIPLMQEAIKKDPSFFYAHRSLIVCLEQTGKEEEALQQYEKCITLAPGDKTLVYNCSQLYLKRKEYEKAALWLRKALEIDPTYEKAAKSLQSVEEYLKSKGNATLSTAVQDNGSASAAKVYNDALDLYKAAKYKETADLLNAFEGEVLNPSFYYLLAIAYQQLGERDKAIEAYEQTLELDDRHFDANMALGTIYFNNQQYSEAVPLLETAYERRKNDRKVLYLLAKAHFKNSEFADAANLLTAYTEMVSDDADAYFMLYQSCEKTGDKKRAQSAFDQAKKYGANGSLAKELDREAATYGQKAAELSKSGNYQGAISVLEEAISKHSEEANLHFNLGLNYLEIGNKEKASEEFAKTVALDPAHAKAYQSLGTLYYDKGDYNNAISYYMATIKAGREEPVLEYKLGNCFYNLSQFPESVPHYKKAADSGIKEKQFFFGLALAYLKLREFPNSINALEQAVLIDPDFWEAHYHICINYLELNEPQKVVDRAGQIVAKNPNYAKAHLAMAMAYKKLGNLAEADKSRQTALKLDPSLK